MNQGTIQNAQNRKQKMLDASKKMLKNSQECGKKYLSLLKTAKKAYEDGNQEGAMIYCTDASRQKKFEKRCLIYSNHLEALAHRVEDAIMQHESAELLSETSNALKTMTGLNAAVNLDETLENMKRTSDNFADTEIKMAELFNDNIFTCSTAEDSQPFNDLFFMLSQEHHTEVESQVPRAPDLQSLDIDSLPDLALGTSNSSTSTSISNLRSL